MSQEKQQLTDAEVMEAVVSRYNEGLRYKDLHSIGLRNGWVPEGQSEGAIVKILRNAEKVGHEVKWRRPNRKKRKVVRISDCTLGGEPPWPQVRELSSFEAPTDREVAARVLVWSDDLTPHALRSALRAIWPKQS